MEDKDIISLYERLRKESLGNVVKTGVENLSFDLAEWRIMDNPHNMSKDLHITVNISDKREILVIRYDELELVCNGESNTIKVGRMIAERIREKLAEFVADKIGEEVFRSCAQALVRLK